MVLCNSGGKAVGKVWLQPASYRTKRWSCQCCLSSPKHVSPVLLYTEEFEAHSSSVSCLALGKSSGRLLATGGEDCRVNIWAVSKANCIMVRHPHRTSSTDGAVMGCRVEYVVKGYLCVCVCACVYCLVSQSLTGHKNPVECVQFNMSEEQVVAGSQSGSIRVWDLEAAKSESNLFCMCVCECERERNVLRESNSITKQHLIYTNTGCDGAADLHVALSCFHMIIMKLNENQTCKFPVPT